MATIRRGASPFSANWKTEFQPLPGVLSLSGTQEPLIADSDRAPHVTVEGEPPALAGTRHVMRNAIGPGIFHMGFLAEWPRVTRADVAGSPMLENAWADGIAHDMTSSASAGGSPSTVTLEPGRCRRSRLLRAAKGEHSGQG